MDITLLFNVAAIAAIIAVTKVITTFDGAGRLARFYPLFPLVLAVIPAILLAKPLALANWQAIAMDWFTIGAGAAYAYKLGKTTLLGQ